MSTPLWDEAASGVAYWQAELWQPLADRLVAHAQLQANDWVLDVCCGTGTSAYPAALAVGSSGRVDAIDISSAMIELARQSSKPLPQLNFSTSDLTSWPQSQAYDAILCGFGLFFLGTPPSALALLKSQLRPGGKVVLSCWQNRPFEPLSGLVIEALAEEGITVQVTAEVRNIGKVNSAEKLNELLTTNGFAEVQIEAVPHSLGLSAESGWQFIQGSLLKASLPESPAALERLQQRLATSLDGLTIRADALIARATH